MPHRPAGGRREAWLAGLVLTALLLIFFWDAVLLGRALLAADMNYLRDPLWREALPPDFRLPKNPEPSDTVDQFYPWRAYIYHWLRQGELPLWNPHILGGMTFVGNDQSAMFYPINLIAYLLPLTSSFAFTAFARLLLAALATYGFLRVSGRGVAAAYLGAITFTLGGFIVVWLGYPIVNVAVWLPAILLLIELIFRSGRRLWVGLLALAVGAQFLGGHAETSFHILLVASAYGLYLATRARRLGARALARRGLLHGTVGAILGSGVGAIQVLPFLEQLTKSPVAAERTGSMYTSLPLFDPAFWPQLATLLTILFPTAFGSPVEPDSGHYLLRASLASYTEYTAYVGTLPLVLAGVGAACWRRDGRLAFWLAVGILSLGVAYRFPLFEVINHLPLFNITANHRFRLVVAFAIAALAAGGLDWLLGRLAPGAGGRSGDLRRLSGLLGALGLVLVAGLLGGYLALSLWREEALALAISLGYLEADAHSELVRGRLAPANWRMYLPGLLLVTLGALIWWARRAQSGRRLVALGVPVLTAAELMAYGQGYNPAIEPRLAFPETPAIRFLREHAGAARVAGLDLALMPNSAMVWGLHDVRGYEVVWLARMRRLLLEMEGRLPVPFGTYQLLSEPDSRLLDLLGVRYLIVGPRPSAPDPARFRPVYQAALPSPDGGEPPETLTIYENLDALPRAYFVGQARALDDPDAIYEMVRQAVPGPAPPAGGPPVRPDPGSSAANLPLIEQSTQVDVFDPRREVLLEVAQQPPLDGLQPGLSRVEIATERPNYLTIQATIGGDGYLVLSDAYDDSWVASVDGRPAPIYRANYAFRAVRIGPGMHLVEFTYRPVGFLIGAVLTIVSLVAVAGLLLAATIATRRRAGSKGTIRSNEQAQQPGTVGTVAKSSGIG